MTVREVRRLVIATNQYAYGDAKTGGYILVDPDMEFMFDNIKVETIEAYGGNTIVMWLDLPEDNSKEKHILARDRR